MIPLVHFSALGERCLLSATTSGSNMSSRNTSNHRTQCGRLALGLLGLLALLSVAYVPSVARAGVYKMYACNVPFHPTVTPTIGPWAWQLDGVNTIGFDNCAAGGSFGIRINPSQRFMRPSTGAALVLRRPEEGPYSRIGIVRYRTWLIAQLSGYGAPAFVSEGGAVSPPGSANSDTAPWVSPLFAQGNPAVAVGLYCSSGAPGNCNFDSETPLQARGIEVDLYEENAPGGTIVGGSLLADETISGTKTIGYTATDEESGVARVEALLGDSIVGRHELEADPTWCHHTGFSACHRTRSSDMLVDASRVAQGRHVLSLRITDAAGNRKVLTGPAINVGLQKAPGDVELAASFARSGRKTETRSFGHRVEVRGRLTDRQDRGVSGAAIAVSERVAVPGAGPGRTRHVPTREDGLFAYTVSARASSRTITLRYEGLLQDRKVVAVRSLRLRVRASAKLSVSLRGTLVRYSGRVTTTPLPKKGKLVLIQGRAKGGVWQSFAKRLTTSGGRFRGTYRLRVYRPGVRLEFRVRIPHERRYAFVTGVGRVVSKVVR